MNSDQLMEARLLVQATEAVYRDMKRVGNPYHDAEGKFTSAGGGSGGAKHAHRARRRKRKAEAIRRRHKREATSLKASHRSERRSILRDQRRDWRGLKREQKAERRDLLRDQARERREGSATKGEHRRERQAMREAQSEERESRRSEYREERAGHLETHKEERHEIRDRYDEELSEHGFARKSARAHNGRGVLLGPREQTVVRSRDGQAREIPSETRRFSTHRTHKASSAESILRHCLKRRGWTAQWRRGELTGREQLDLLGDIREYARGWLRHEAEVLFAHHGVPSTGQRTLVLGGDDLRGGVSHRADECPGVGDLRALTDALTYHVGRFFGRVKSFVREAILAGARALFGPEPLSALDLAEVERQTQAQVAYLDRFERDAHFRTPEELAAEGLPGVEPMTGPQFIARAEMYGDAPWGAAQQVERRRMIAGGQYVEERRIHGLLIDDMCSTCAAAVAQGWVPVGTLPAIGDSECVGNCHCYFVYRDAQGNQAKTIRPLRGRKPRLTRKPIPEPEFVAPPEVATKPEAAKPKPKPQPKAKKPKPVKVQPIEPTEKPPEILIGPWVDAAGNAITYHYEEAP